MHDIEHMATWQHGEQRRDDYSVRVLVLRVQNLTQRGSILELSREMSG